MLSVNIENIQISNQTKPVLIAEIGINHEGSLKIAKEMAQLAVENGADIIKHQTHIVEDEMSIEANQFEVDYPETKFRLVRYGNVLYSTGSVLCLWKDKLQRGEEVIVTEPKATRFFWTLEQAVDLIFDCMENAVDSKVHFPSMKSMRIDNLLKAMSEKYLPEGQGLKVKEIGLQPGENLHEKILEQGPYSNEVDEFTIEEIKELI